MGLTRREAIKAGLAAAAGLAMTGAGATCKIVVVHWTARIAGGCISMDTLCYAHEAARSEPPFGLVGYPSAIDWTRTIGPARVVPMRPGGWW